MNIISGCDMDMGDLVYEPPRDGPTLWEIGIPDRSAAEFYIPGPDPKFMNNLYANHPDSMVCGADMQICTLIQIWFTQSVSVTTEKTGSLLRLSGEKTMIHM